MWNLWTNSDKIIHPERQDETRKNFNSDNIQNKDRLWTAVHAKIIFIGLFVNSWSDNRIESMLAVILYYVCKDAEENWMRLLFLLPVSSASSKQTRERIRK